MIGIEETFLYTQVPIKGNPMNVSWFNRKSVPTLFCLIAASFLVFIRFPELVQYFNDAIPYANYGVETHVRRDFLGGDHFQVFYNGWKLKQSMLDPDASAFSDPYNFAARGKVFYDGMIGMQYVQHALLSFLMPETAAYNLNAVVLSTALCTLFAHLFFRSLGARWWQAILLAISFAWLPYRIQQVSGGHSGGIVAYFVPLYFYAIFEFRKRGFLRFAILAGATLFLLTISDEHQGYYLLIASMFIFPTWLVQDLSSRGWKPHLAIEFAFRWRYLLAGLLLVVVWGFVLDHYILVSHERPSGSVRGFREIQHYSRNLSDHLSMRSGVNIGNIFFYALIFGLIPISIAIVTASGSIREFSKKAVRHDSFPLWVVLFLSLFITVGLGRHWSQKTGIYDLFYDFLPYFKYQRVPGKMFSIPALSLAAVAMLTFNWIERRFRQRGKPWVAASVMVAGGICFAAQAVVLVSSPGALVFASTHPFADDTIKLIKNHADDDDIIVLYPSPFRMDGYATLPEALAIHTKRKFAQGYQGAPPIHFERISRKLVSELNPLEISPKLEAMMDKLGYTHVLVDLTRQKEFASIEEYNIGSAAEARKPWKELGCSSQFCLFKLGSP